MMKQKPDAAARNFPALQLFFRVVPCPEDQVLVSRYGRHHFGPKTVPWGSTDSLQIWNVSADEANGAAAGKLMANIIANSTSGSLKPQRGALLP